MTDEFLKGYPVVIQLPIIWGEMDSYRHVNNVVYFRYFESARVEYFRRLGWTEFNPDDPIGPILAATEAVFKRPLTFPDTISVGARLAGIAEDRFHLEHVIVSHTQDAVTTVGKGTVVTFDYRANKKVPVPESLKRKLSQLEGRQL